MKLTKSMISRLATIGVTVGVIVALVVVGFLSWNISAFVNRPVEKEETYSIREEIMPIAKLATYEYNFTQILYYSSVNADNPFSIEIPFSENKYIATIEGSATIQVNAEEMTFEPHFLNNYLVGVDVSLPHSEVKQPVALDFETLEVLERRDGFLNEITDEQLNSLLVETNQEQVKKAEKSGLLSKSDTRIQDLISAQLRAIYGQDLTINFHFIDR